MLSQTSLRVCDYQAQTSMRSHEHQEASINIVVRGAFVERIGKRERNYARGQIAYLPAGVVHSQTFGGSSVRQIIFRPQPCWLDYLVDCKTRLTDSPHTNSPTFGQLGDRLLQEMARDDRFSAFVCEGIVLEIVAAFGRNSTAERASAKPPAWLCATREFIHENSLVPLNMKHLARVAGRHEIHIAREFRRFFGASVGAYARQLRTEHAARLLLQPQLSISDIASDCGFSSHSHLCREFKVRFGVTPSQYRCNTGLVHPLESMGSGASTDFGPPKTPWRIEDYRPRITNA